MCKIGTDGIDVRRAGSASQDYRPFVTPALWQAISQLPASASGAPMVDQLAAWRKRQTAKLSSPGTVKCGLSRNILGLGERWVENSDVVLPG